MTEYVLYNLRTGDWQRVDPDVHVVPLPLRVSGVMTDDEIGFYLAGTDVMDTSTLDYCLGRLEVIQEL